LFLYLGFFSLKEGLIEAIYFIQFLKKNDERLKLKTPNPNIEKGAKRLTSTSRVGFWIGSLQWDVCFSHYELNNIT